MTLLTETRDQTTTNPNRARAQRATEVAGRFASIVTGRKIRSVLVDGGASAPAWSDASGIWFSTEHISSNLHLPEGVLSIKGLTCHELAHILYTPRYGAHITRFVRENGYRKAFNILEDARIERLLSGRYSRAVVPWLTATVAQHLLADEKAIGSAFVLTHGRKYLPLDVRRAVRQAFVAQHLVKAFADVLDEYIGLIFPRDSVRGEALIRTFNSLLDQLKSDTGDQPEGGCGSDPTGFASGEGERPATASEQTADQQNASQTEQGDDDMTNDDEASDGQSDSGQADETDDSSDDEATDGGSGQDDDDADEGEASDGQTGGGQTGEGQPDDAASNPGQPGGDQPAVPSDGQPSSTPSDGASAGDADSKTAQVVNTLEGIIDAIENEHAKDIARTIADYNGEEYDEGLADEGIVLNDATTTDIKVADNVRVYSDEFAKELRAIQTANDPGWEREVASGRISATRYLRGCDVNEAFDRWNPGKEDATDIECVILLDASGSMKGEPLELATQAMWGIKHAIDDIGGATTVVAFGSRAEVLYSSAESASEKVRALTSDLGGTQPLNGLRYARDTFSKSSRAVKILFTITDGAWGDAQRAEDVVTEVREAGVLTALGYVSPYGGGESLDSVDGHNSEVVSSLSSARDILTLGRSLVALAIERGLAR
jgi:hypothetical protein